MPKRRSTARTISLLAIAGIVLGSLGPWATTPFGSKAGTSGDGVITLLIAVAAAALLLTFKPPRGSRRLIVVAALGIVCAYIGISNIIDINNNSTQTVFGVQADLVKVNWGLWMTTLASGVLAVGAWLMRGNPGRGLHL
jgi:hypothetical protein